MKSSVKSYQPAGVLRLRSCFASRSSYSAQDDIFRTFGFCRVGLYLEFSNQASRNIPSPPSIILTTTPPPMRRTKAPSSLEEPTERQSVQQVGVLRLRSCFASRSSYSAQDDNAITATVSSPTAVQAVEPGHTRGFACPEDKYQTSSRCGAAARPDARVFLSATARGFLPGNEPWRWVFS